MRTLKETEQPGWRNTPVEEGQAVRIDYTAFVVDPAADAHSAEDAGKEVETRTISFRCGSGRVMKALDMGVIGMRVGDRRRVRAPHTHAYGREGKPPLIEPFSEVIFDITLTGAVHHMHIEVLDSQSEDDNSRIDLSPYVGKASSVIASTRKLVQSWLSKRD